MRKNVSLYIPTINRVNKQETFNNLPPEWKKGQKTFIVCPENEKKRHEAAGRNVLVHPASCTHIGRVRQWIVDNAKTKFILMSDDDHTFCSRIKPDAYNLKVANELETIHMLSTLETMLVVEKYHHIGVDARQGNNRHFPHDFLINTRVNNFHGFNRETLIKHKIRFDALPLMEDFHVTLSLLELGYANKLLTQYCWNQPGSNAPGGCSGYRTPELQTKAANMLKEKHPDFVTVVEKQAKGWGAMKTRTDVRIQWKKAFLSSGKEAPTA